MHVEITIFSYNKIENLFVNENIKFARNIWDFSPLGAGKSEKLELIYSSKMNINKS